MEPAFDYDWVVVGSGFGGSVSALRLAQKGHRVAVLECGRRFDDDDFARTTWEATKYYWMPKVGLRGIFRLTLFKDVFVASGCGVGGGSLGYANTLYRGLLRADGARRRRPLDAVHDGGDVRADAAGHEGPRRRGGDRAGQRLHLWLELERLHPRSRSRRTAREADRGRQRLRQRRAEQLPRAASAVRRLEGLRSRWPSRRRRHPQVLQDAERSRHPLRGQAGSDAIPAHAGQDQSSSS